MSQAESQRFGKYLLVERLAEGGMAEVFLAKRLGAEGFEKELVIKRILPHFSEDESFVTMFKDEARIAATLNHANLVQVFEFDIEDGFFYLAMEYIEGKDLKRVLDRGAELGRHLSPAQCAHIIACAADGLHYAHTREYNGVPLNIVHRDVSPHNIMISMAGDVKVMDFGIAKAAARSTKTRAGTVKGKCGYMSPEQARGKDLDGRSDVFSLGICLWEMLSRRRLFVGETEFEVLTRVLRQEVEPPSRYNPDCPPEMDRIVARALERDRERRYETAGAFRKDLLSLLYRELDPDSVKLDEYMKALFGGDTAASRSPGACEPGSGDGSGTGGRRSGDDGPASGAVAGVRAGAGSSPGGPALRPPPLPSSGQLVGAAGGAVARGTPSGVGRVRSSPALPPVPVPAAGATPSGIRRAGASAPVLPEVPPAGDGGGDRTAQIPLTMASRIAESWRASSTRQAGGEADEPGPPPVPGDEDGGDAGLNPTIPLESLPPGAYVPPPGAPPRSRGSMPSLGAAAGGGPPLGGAPPSRPTLPRSTPREGTASPVPIRPSTPSQPAWVPVRPAPSPTRRGRLALVLALVAVVLLGGGVGAFLLLGGGPSRVPATGVVAVAGRKPGVKAREAGRRQGTLTIECVPKDPCREARVTIDGREEFPAPAGDHYAVSVRRTIGDTVGITLRSGRFLDRRTVTMESARQTVRIEVRPEPAPAPPPAP